MKPLIIFLALTFAFVQSLSAAFAESWKLFENKAWSVYYVDEPGVQPWCYARSIFINGTMVTLSGNGHNTSLNFFNANVNFHGISGTLALWVDNKTYWTAVANGTGNTLFIDNPDREFLAEFYLGQWIYFDLGNDGYAEYSFPLAGSASALRVLGDCVSKLR